VVGTGIAIAIVAWHLTRAVRPKQELLLVLSAAAIGALFDSLLVALGWLPIRPARLSPALHRTGSWRCGCCSPSPSI